VSLGESDLRRGIAVLDQYREQIEALAQQQDLVRISLEEHLRAKETLTQYRQAGRGAEVLVPIGANSFVAAESKDVDKAEAQGAAVQDLYERLQAGAPPGPRS